MIAPPRQKLGQGIAPTDPPNRPVEFVASVQEHLVREGLYAPPDSSPSGSIKSWRISPEPFWITSRDLAFFEQLGNHLLAFTRAINILYYESVKGHRPAWVAEYLDQGKPEAVVEFSRMNRFKQSLPGILRPDMIPLEEGRVVTELDSVPGGIGLTGFLTELYAKQEYAVAGPPFGMVEGFARMVRSLSGKPSPVVAVAVSEESKDYEAEMRWLARALGSFGVTAEVVDPGEILFGEEGLYLPPRSHTPGDEPVGETGSRIDVIYRFFELFDLKNIRKSELILYAVRKGKVLMTPPPKAHLEEKMAFALFHHPILRDFWERHLAKDTLEHLDALIPRTWVLDPRPLPPHTVIPGLSPAGRPVQEWADLSRLGQKERAYVIKPSGFSELAWGSRGISVGHDLSEKDWSEALARALSQFRKTPHLLQEFRKGKQYVMNYYDFAARGFEPMRGRVRLSPYYFVAEGEASLGGILASFVPADKKLIHGMTHGIMAPCAVLDSSPH